MLITKGQKINDRYEIIKSIGEGGMANVYLAQDTILDRKVAIKVLRGDLANDEKFIRRFQREALSASSLSHPNIVEMYDVGEDNGSHYIVMEYIEGKTVKQLLKKRGNLTVSEAVDIMLQLTDGISHAHDSYIIHRDLKPQNIMIQEDGQIKITDFGIAMALNSTQLTQTNSVMGSVHYLPPEQASGKGSTIKCDIYSMGILFYELLTGVLPFKGDNAVEIALKHMKDPLPSVRKQNSNIPQSVENIIIKSTAKNPKNRYNDVKEMYRDLKACMDPDVMNQERFVYKYPEHESEENKDPIPAIRSKKTDDKKKKNVEDSVEIIEEEIAKEIDGEEDNKGGMKIVIWVLVGILLLLVGVLALVFIPNFFGKEEEVKIPDVSGMSIVDAEEVLKNEGLEVATDTIGMVSGEYDKGLVVKTDPIAGRRVPEGTVITIYESLGEETYTVENYVGMNYLIVQGELEAYDIEVEVKKQTVEDIDMMDELDQQVIIAQEPAEGTVLSKGDRVILYIPDIYDKYPDFVEEKWTVEEVEEFCSNYGIVLQKKYQKTSSYEPGTIIRQSRKVDTKITKGASLTITIAEAIVEEPPVVDDNSSENTEDTPEENNGAGI
ncbi:MAG: Stk1 family PASTA domain-containing Ser/Thr kinase [Bacilli bacterium]|nr:Stk1 family PASTA domain-containing Ser/Thr kinase [Bacilli bacterium]